MNQFPLIRTKWSNERLMAVLMLALVLYQLPRFIVNPADIWGFAALMAFGLALDTAANYVRFRRPMCAVSAGVTAALLAVLSPGVPLWGQFIAVAVALLIGKHVWGGTGKNPVNPAMVGLLLLGLVFPYKMQVFAPSVWLLPAVLLSLPFLFFRPFAAIGMLGGMIVALLLQGQLSVANILAYGVVLWGCLVITDPVTTTAKPAAGVLLGALAGYIPLALGGEAAAMALGVLGSNALSAAADSFMVDSCMQIRLKFGKRERTVFLRESTVLQDLTGGVPQGVINDDITAGESLSAQEILARIVSNKVFGFGGAAFPTERKIRAVLGSRAPQKHLIVNGVECDPGLIHDKWLLTHHWAEINRGISLLCRCIAFDTVTVAAKDVSGLAFAAPIRLHQAPDYYPCGAERILIEEALGVKLANGEIPAHEGILLLNVQTIFAIYEAVCLNRKADTRFLTVADADIHTGSVVRVRLGTRVQDLINTVRPGAALGFTGGGIMNARIAVDDAVVDETVNFIAVGKLPGYRESPLCSRCGLCNAVCPARLPVHQIARFADDGMLERTVRIDAEKCMACGSCSHVCLAGRNLSARVTAAKQYQRKQRTGLNI